MKEKYSLHSRRRFLKTTAAVTAGLAVSPHIISCAGSSLPLPMKRSFGKLGFDVTTLGLGGQASIQWTPSDVDPVKIILKAFKLGINYFDTSNLYGPSQNNYGKAFSIMNLIPGKDGYDMNLRQSIFLTSKTRLYWAKGGYAVPGYRSSSNGNDDYPAVTLSDIRRSLSQIFGDGKGNYPEGAYLDMVLAHTLNSVQEVDILYQGLEDTSPDMEHIGALAALRDVRDGTNLTGLNPRGEKLIRHIGFSGHHSAPAMMEMIRRDKFNLLDGMLVTVNANDKLNLNMQHNVIPVAAARNMGIIAMKVFADGAMYEKPANWSNNPEHVIRHTGTEKIPATPLVHYALTTPGVHTAIIGIGHVDDNPALCQLHQNFLSAQIEPDGLGELERKEIEAMAAGVKEGKTNWFQIKEGGLTACKDSSASQEMTGAKRTVTLAWGTALAGAETIQKYQVSRDGEVIGEVPHIPQTSNDPFLFEDSPEDKGTHSYQIITVDASGNRAESEMIPVNSVG
jgi:aryl-alcohol dehydrogenase-like predicted oxidoreductase